MGEAKRKAALRDKVGISVDTFGGRIHVEWDPDGDNYQTPVVL